MRAVSASSRSWRHLEFFALICLQFVLGFSGDSKSSNTGSKVESHSSSSKTSTKAILILTGVVAIGLVSFFLFKMWQKKKRDEQYARLLKLFEEDDELEVELGLRD